MKFFKPKDLLFLLFPNLRLLKLSFDCVKCGYKAYKFRKSYKNYKMKFAMKLAIGSGIAFFVVVLFGFVAFPTLIKSKIKKMTALVPKNDIRGMFTKVPFPLDFNIYIFNVTNPMEVQEGGKPNLQEIGPFCYEEWKTKVNITDSEAEDAMYYQAVDTFYPRPDKGCMTGEEIITIIHPLIVGMVNTVMRQKPGAIGLISKAIKSIYKDPTSIYLTAKAKDILFDGVIIDCDVKDFAGKAVCSQLRTEATDLRHVSETELAFSFLAPKNATPGKFFKVHRGKKHNRQLGAIIEFDEKPVMSNWPTDKCNQIKGTDGTIFPPFLQKSDGLVSFSPDLCRSLAAFYVHDDHYDGVPVWAYSATFGDMSKNADEKCYCYSNDTCLKKGLMDLYNCAGVPLYVSFPHFYDSDESYLNAVTGLKPVQEEHEIKILFEHTTGSPVFARKRLQFNMPLEPNEKVPIFQNLPRLVHPLFWIEEGVSLNNTYTGQLKDLFKMMKIVKITKWLLMMATLLTFGVAFILMMQKSGKAEITSIQKVKPTDEKHNNGISKVSNAVEDNGMDKY